MTPGNKNGWSQEEGGWVVNTVGFAGPQQRYTLSIMNALGGEGGYDDGVTTTTQLSRICWRPPPESECSLRLNNRLGGGRSPRMRSKLGLLP